MGGTWQRTFSHLIKVFVCKFVCLHAQLNPIKAIVRLCSAIGQQQLSNSTRQRVIWFIGRSMSCPGTIGGAGPISTSGNRATGWPLYDTSNNKLRQHSKKMFSVDSCHFTPGPYNYSDAPLFRPPEQCLSYADSSGCSAYDKKRRGEIVWTRSELTAVYWKHCFLLHVVFQSGFHRVKAKVPFPQFLHHGRDNPHYESLLVVEVPENPAQSLRIIISENTPVSLAAAQWMNKDCRYYFTTLLMRTFRKNMYF